MGGWRPRAGGARRYNIVTVLIAINVGVYLLATFPGLGRWIYGLGVMQGHAVMQGQVWRLITAQYLHDPASSWHLIFNMIGLFFLGQPLQQMWSARKFFAIYTLCGLSGMVLFTILASINYIDPNSPAVGASGCIYGLLGIVAVLFPHATVYIYFLFPIKIRTAAILFAAISLWTIVSRGGNYGGEVCHFAGLGFGVWWAMHGERWWNATEWRVPGRRSAGRRKVGAGAWAAKMAERRDDEDTIDRILKKVYDKGIHSLTEGEKHALQQATDRQKEREAQAGRVDRL